MRRRDFLKVGLAAAVATTIPLGAAAQESAPISAQAVSETENGYEMTLVLDPSKAQAALDGKDLRVKWYLWIGAEKEELSCCGDQMVAPSPDGRYRLTLRHPFPLPPESLHVFQWQVFGPDGTSHDLSAQVVTPGVVVRKKRGP